MSPLPSLEFYDDLKILNHDLTDHPGVTLFSIIKNERFFIQPFLDHYRTLGVERFIFLDDHSTDGTREFLLKQSDCMILTSQRTFGEVVPLTHRIIAPPSLCRKKIQSTIRIRNIWLNLLVRKYAIDRWSLYVEADEFLRIPDGMKLQDLISQLEDAQANAVWGLMLDLYPARFSDLVEMQGDPVLNRDRGVVL